MVEALVAGPVVVERYDAAIQSFVPYFQTGREGRPPEVLARLSPTTEEALVGGMVSLISRRIIAGKAEELEELLPDLVEFTLTPYLGSAEAAELARERTEALPLSLGSGRFSRSSRSWVRLCARFISRSRRASRSDRHPEARSRLRLGKLGVAGHTLRSLYDVERTDLVDT